MFAETYYIWDDQILRDEEKRKESFFFFWWVDGWEGWISGILSSLPLLQSSSGTPSLPTLAPTSGVCLHSRENAELC